MKIVSVTPLPLAADSRSLKFARTFSQSGFDSELLGGSSLSECFRGNGSGSGGPAAKVSAFRSKRISAMNEAFGFLRSLLQQIRQAPLSVVLTPVLGPVFVLAFLTRFFIRPIARLPRADLYYLHSYEYFPLISFKTLFRRILFVYDAHDLYNQLSVSRARTSFERCIERPFFDLIESRCIKSASLVVTVSPALGERLRSRSKHQPLIVRNLHDPSMDHQPQRNFRLDAGAIDSDLLCIVVGNAKPSMRIESLVDVFEHLPPTTKLAFVGRNYHRSSIRTRANVLFLDPVDPREVVPYIRSADIAIVPYVASTENDLGMLPNGIFQTIAAGLPLVAPGLPEIKGLLKNYNQQFIIDFTKPEEIEAALLTLHDQTTRKRTASNVQAIARELTWDHEVLPLISQIKHLLISSYR